jgi:hypothetical protein
MLSVRLSRIAHRVKSSKASASATVAHQRIRLAARKPAIMKAASLTELSTESPA